MPTCLREGSALAVLRRLTGLLQTGLLALLDPRVASQHPGLLQHGPAGIDVGLVERTSNAEAECAGLAADAAALDPGDDVVRAVDRSGRERLRDDLLVHLVRKI